MTTAVRSAIGETVSWGDETTPNSGGTANMRPSTLLWDVAPAGNGFQIPHPSGSKFAGGVVPTDYWTTINYRQAADFNIIPYLTATGIGYVAPTGTTAKTWAITPTIGPGGTYKTLVGQRGQTGAVETYRNIVTPDISMKYVREQPIEISGRHLARKQVLGTSLTSPTAIPYKAMSSAKTSIFTPGTFGNFAADGTAFDPICTDLEWHYLNAWAPYFGLDASIIGPAGFLEGEVDCGGTISIAFDVASSDHAGTITNAKMEAGTPVQVRLKVFTVEEIESGVPYTLFLDLNIVATAPPKIMRGRNNLKVAEWTYTCVPELTTTGLPFTGKVINTLADL